MKRYEFGGLGGKFINTTEAVTSEFGYRFVAIHALTDITLASTGTVNISGLGSSSQTASVPASNMVYGIHTTIRLTTGGQAFAYYGV